ncbi:unnamed protein product [Phytophthora lilii]|uniref:Unnamed protein product n=1 Tax=Phytophthora lilii TaxID=2077276 RepID=A0A9W6WRD4_9STRA|nr:unnamed protein product [Phytophthora lilii]
MVQAPAVHLAFQCTNNLTLIATPLGYNPVLRVSAMSLGPSVAITRYADNDATARFSAGVLNQPTDTLVLHEGSTTSFRLVAWSRGSGDKSLLAIASTTTVEIWEVTVARAQNHLLHGFGWKNIDSLRTELPKHDQIDISSSLQGGKEIRLEVGNASFGPIAAITRISSSACIITTDTKLILEDIPRLNSAKNFNLRRTIPNETGVSSQLLLHSKDSQRVQIREEAVRTSRDVIDLTSIRVSASSTQSSLQILNRIELPPSHVSRGIFLAERSPFVDVASTEKRESATFFHAAASLESQPIYLSKFKMPRRVQPRPSATPTGSAQEAVAIAADKTPKSAAAESRRSETQDLLELVMTRMTAMQTQLNARFDDVDRRLQQLAARVEQLDGGTRGT